MVNVVILCKILQKYQRIRINKIKHFINLSQFYRLMSAFFIFYLPDFNQFER